MLTVINSYAYGRCSRAIGSNKCSREFTDNDRVATPNMEQEKICGRSETAIAGTACRKFGQIHPEAVKGEVNADHPRARAG